MFRLIGVGREYINKKNNSKLHQNELVVVEILKAAFQRLVPGVFQSRFQLFLAEQA